jgi:hypothetical protein
MFAHQLLALGLTPLQTWVGIAAAGLILLVVRLLLRARQTDATEPPALSRAANTWGRSPHRLSLPSDLDQKVEDMWK